jgi:bifunctional NMN adenylyltransferase/nudix hydrolase
MDNGLNLRTKEEINPADYEVGCLIMRLQVHELHDAHKALIDLVLNNHKKVILFLGVAVIQNTKRNPLDFATRAAMVRELYPNIVILPLNDRRNDEEWSRILDDSIKLPYGDKKALLYGGRDSFIPYYSGKHQTTELTTDRFLSGTEIRKEVSREIRTSSDFRAGVIHSSYAQRPTIYQTVDIALVNDDFKLLLARKPGEAKWRFPGGFVDVNLDECLEDAAVRELREECGAHIKCGEMKYLGSSIIDDWRYRKEDSKIMSSLFVTSYINGEIQPNDDVFELLWVDIIKLDIEANIMPEHVNFASRFALYLSTERLKTIPKEKLNN